jgi:hypothetical protein
VESDNPDKNAADVAVDWPYSGWIPTAVGRLSFRHIGDTDFPVRAEYANRVDASDFRYIVVRQYRALSDALFPSLTDTFSNRSGKFVFVLAARSDQKAADNSACIVGSVYIVPDFEPSPVAGAPGMPGQDEITSKADEAINAINSRRSYGPARSPEDEYASIANYLDLHTPIRITFALARDGVVGMAKPEFIDAELGCRSIVQAKARGVDYERYLAEQAYFFLRDIAHAHQHHEPQTDTLISLQERDANDTAWRNNILFALHHHVIGQRRRGDPETLTRTLDVIAYARAFEACCEKALRGRELVRFESDALAQSVAASVRACEIRALENERRRTHGRALAIWASVAVISILAIFVQPRLDPQEAEVFPRLYALSAVFAEYIAVAIGIAIVIPFAAAWANWARQVDNRSGSIRNTLRTPLYFDSLKVSLTYIMLGLVLIGYVIYIYFPVIWPLVSGLLMALFAPQIH